MYYAQLDQDDPEAKTRRIHLVGSANVDALSAKS
jgi:hypothetical protein